MARKVFFSFHYDADHWRASQVRNIGAIEGNTAVADNDWETVKKGGDPAIKKWIDGQLSGRSCAVVLIGAATTGRKWIDYEIGEAWNSGKGVVGIHVHRLKGKDGVQSTKGTNPFTPFTMNGGWAKGKSLATLVKAYDVPLTDSKAVYAHIAANLEAWVEDAINVREGYA